METLENLLEHIGIFVRLVVAFSLTGEEIAEGKSGGRVHPNVSTRDGNIAFQ